MVSLPVLDRWEGHERTIISKSQRSSDYGDPSGIVLNLSWMQCLLPLDWSFNYALLSAPLSALLQRWLVFLSISNQQSVRLIINHQRRRKVNSSMVFHAVLTAVTKMAALGRWISVSGMIMLHWSTTTWCRRRTSSSVGQWISISPWVYLKWLWDSKGNSRMNIAFLLMDCQIQGLSYEKERFDKFDNDTRVSFARERKSIVP